MQHPRGKQKQAMEYTGIAYATDFIKTSLPAVDRSFSIHPLSFSETLSRKYLKVMFLDCPTSVGIHNFLSLSDSF